jgi:hypothetical protein
MAVGSGERFALREALRDELSGPHIVFDKKNIHGVPRSSPIHNARERATSAAAILS